MTTRLIFVRHGESEGNLRHCFVGQQDVPLTERGRAQAQAAAKHLQTVPIDAFYASDLRRAHDTARCIAEAHKAQVIPVKALREIFAGAWEGRVYGELEACYPTEYSTWVHDIGRAQCTGGESVLHLYERIHCFVDALVKDHAGQTVLCATHATPIRALLCRWHGILPENMKDIPWTKNASLTIAEYHGDGSVAIKAEGDISFLPQNLVTYLPSNV